MSLYLGKEHINKVSVSFITPSGEDGNLATPTINPSTGLITSSVDKSGYILSGTSKTLQLPIQSTTTITPTSDTQVAVSSGKYTTGNVLVSAVPSEIKNIVSNGTYTPSTGKWFSSVTVNVPSDTIELQEKTVTPSENLQTVNPDNGYGGLSSVKVNPISSTYVGSGVNRISAKTITPSNTSQTAVNSNTYTTGAISISAVPSETKEITSNGIYTPSDGKWFSSVSVNVSGNTFNTQTKSVTPTESKQVVSPDSGYDGLSSVTVEAISTTHIGSGVTRKGATTITPSTSSQIAVSSGTYVTGDIAVNAMPNGSLSTPTINSSGLVTAQVGTSGYIASGTSKTLQLNTKSAATIVPSENVQTIASGQYLTGTQTIAAIPSDYIGSAVIVQNYYTGSTEPSSSLGNNGDLYLKV